MTSVKKVKVALLALVAALVIAIPTSAFAGTIAINSQTTGDIYEAYQIFAGEHATNTEGKEVLSKVEWGNAIAKKDQAKALEAVQELGGQFATATDAASVAEALAAIEDKSAEADAFAAAIAPFLKSNPYSFGTTNPYTVALPEDGYYLVKQTTPGTAANDQTGAKTKFVAQLVGPNTNITVDAKASVPQVFKGVIEDTEVKGDEAAFAKALDNYRKDAHYDTEQGIPYYIAGTLPSTYDDYKTYYYEFNDKMSKGLTYQDDAAVYLAVDGKITGDALKGWKISTSTTDKGETVLTVKTDDLKFYVPEYASNVKVVVLYSAKLNKDCVVGNNGNPNEVSLTYSNNPNQTGEGTPETGETPKEYAVVFTFALDDTKVDDALNTKTLKGAEFKIGKSENGPWATIADDCVTGWVADIDKATAMVSDENGKFGVKGLDADSYVVKETKAPAGYNLKTEVIPFAISAELPNNATAQGGTITATVTGEGAINNGTVSQTVTNKQGGTLPSTGGIGTTIFTIVGIALIVAAAAIMVIRRRNAAAIQ